MKNGFLRKTYYRITLAHKSVDEKYCNSYTVSRDNGIIRISKEKTSNSNSAISPVSLNRTVRRKIKKTVDAN